MGDSVESLAEVEVDNIYGSPFIYSAFLDRSYISLCSSLPLPTATTPGSVKPLLICIKRCTEGFPTLLWSVLGASGRARSLEQTFDPELSLLNLCLGASSH